MRRFAIAGMLMAAAMAAHAAPRDAQLARDFLRASGMTVRTVFADGMRAQLDASEREETCAAVKPLLRERNRRATQRLDAIAASPRAQALLVDAVQAEFTDAELRQLVAWFQAPAGQLFAKRQATLGGRIATASDAFAKLAIDDASALFEEYGERLESAARQCPQGDEGAGDDPRDADREDERYDDRDDDEGRDDREDRDDRDPYRRER